MAFIYKCGQVYRVIDRPAYNSLFLSAWEYELYGQIHMRECKK